MNYFKDLQDKIHFLSASDLDRGGFDLLPPSCTPVTDEEVELIINRRNQQSVEQIRDNM